MPRIRFASHDNPRPSGGVKTLYQHVELLTQNGFDAAVVHFTPHFSLDWFSNTIPVIDGSQGLKLDRDDWIVIPEDHAQALKHFATIPCRKALFCQNHFYIFEALPPQTGWDDFGIEEVLVSSHEIETYVQRVFSKRSHFIPLFINHKLFQPSADRHPLSVAYMPRKGGWNLTQIISSIWCQYPELRDVQWVPIDRMSEAEVAHTLQSNTIFLSTGFREGFGLPPIEAMACGALVVGFRAGGGKDYATDKNGFWVPDEDPITFAQTLAQILLKMKKTPNHPHWESIRQQGYQTAARYQQDATELDLVRIWTHLLSTD